MLFRSGIAFSRFTSADVVRHPLVGRIVDAYEQSARLNEHTEPAKSLISKRFEQLHHGRK